MIINQNTQLQTLCRTQNNIEVLKARNGCNTLKDSGFFIHSKYDPIKEADKVCNIPSPGNTSLLFILGLGLAYHVYSAQEKLKGQDCKIFIFENKADVILKCKDLTGLDFLNENTYLITGEDWLSSLISLKNKIEFENMKGYRVISLQNSVNLSREFYEDVLTAVNKMLSYDLMESFTKYEMERLWIENIFENVESISKNTLKIRRLPEYITDKPALIVSAGPSLASKLDIILKNKEGFYIFCVDTSLQALLDKGIIPDYVISLDAQIHNLKDFYGVSYKRGSLKIIAGASVYPDIIKYAKKYCFFTALKDNGAISCIEKNTGINIPYIPVDISVTTAAVRIAMAFGFGKIIFAGLDLAYTSDMSHVASSYAYEAFLKKTTKINTLSSSFYNLLKKRNPFILQGAKSDNSMLRLKEVMEIITEDENVNFYTISNGLKIQNARELSREEFSALAMIKEQKVDFVFDDKSISVSEIDPDTSFIEKAFCDIDAFLRSFENTDFDFDKFLKGKDIICEKYIFAGDYLKQDDLYYKRSAEKDLNKKCVFYTLSVINRLKKLSKTLKRAVSKPAYESEID